MALPKKLGNWKVVTLSFLGATTFWFFSALGKDYDSRIKYPIEFVFDSDSLVAVKPLPEYVDIDVAGGGWDLFKETFWFGSDPIIFELDNPAAIRYLTRPTILPIVSGQLDEYSINFLFTDTLFIDIDRKISKRVKLQVDSASIGTDEDYRIVSPVKLTPDTAIIYGPSSFIDTLETTYLVKVDEEDVDEDFSQSISLGLPEAFDIYSNPAAVDLSFEVTRFDRLEMEANVEMQNFPTDSSVFITDPEIKIRFVVQSDLREEYFSQDFEVVVDYNLINPADSLAPAIIIFQPENVIEVEVVPDSLAITYQSKP